MSTQLPRGFNTVEFPVNTGQALACKTPDFVLRFLKSTSSQKLQEFINKPICEFAIQVLLKQKFAGKGSQDEVFYFQLNQNPDLESIPIDVIERMLSGAPLSLGSIVVNLKLKVMSTLGSEIDGQIILEAIKRFQGEVIQGDISDLMGLKKYNLGLVLSKEMNSQKTQAEQAVLEQWRGWESLQEIEMAFQEIEMPLTPNDVPAPLEELLCVYENMQADRRDHPLNKDYLREILTQERIIQSLQNSKIQAELKKYIFNYFWDYLYQREINGVQSQSTQSNDGKESTRQEPVCEPELTDTTNIDELKTELSALKNQIVQPNSTEEIPSVPESEGSTEVDSDDPIQDGFTTEGLFSDSTASSPETDADSASPSSEKLNSNQINQIKNRIYKLETVLILWEMAGNGGQRFGEKFGKEYTKIKKLLSNQDIKMLLQKASKTIGQEMGHFFAKNRDAEFLFSTQERIDLYKDLAQTPGQHFGEYLACNTKSDEHIKEVAELLGQDNFFYVLRALMVAPGQKAGIFFREKMNFLSQYLKSQKVECNDSKIFEWMEQASAVAGQDSAMMLSTHWDKIIISANKSLFGKNQKGSPTLIPGADEMINNTFKTMGQNAGILLENRWKELRELDGNGINLRKLVKKAAQCQSQSIEKFLKTPQGQYRIQTLFPELNEVKVEHIQNLEL